MKGLRKHVGQSGAVCPPAYLILHEAVPREQARFKDARFGFRGQIGAAVKAKICPQASANDRQGLALIGMVGAEGLEPPTYAL